MIAAVLVALLLRSAVIPNAAAQPSMPRPTEAAAHQLAGMEEAVPVLAADPTTTKPPFAAMELLQRDEEMTYPPNICGFVSGSIGKRLFLLERRLGSSHP